RIHNAAGDALAARSRRVGGVPVLFEDPGTASSGAVSRLRQWADDRRHEVRTGGGDLWCRPCDGKGRLAAGGRWDWNWWADLAAGVDAMDAARSRHQRMS